MSFSDQMDDDLDAMLDTAVFGLAATVAGTAVNVIFDEAYGEGYDVAGTSPAIWCKTSDVNAAVIGDAVTVNGASYTVSGIEPDGALLTVLRLVDA